MAADRAPATPVEAHGTSNREAILEAVRVAGDRFLQADASWEASLPEVLAALGEATGVSRAYLFENHRWSADEVWTTQRFEWSAPGVRDIADDPVLADLPMRAAGFSRWIDAFGRGEPIVGLRREFAPEEQVQLAADETLSIAVVPITVDGRWWGMLGFDECAFERRWTSGEIDALRAAASTIGAAIRADRQQRDLEARVAALSEVARSLTVDASLEQTLDGICRTLVASSPALACSVELWTDDGPRIVGTHGLPEGYVEHVEARMSEAGASGAPESVFGHETVWIEDALEVMAERPGSQALIPLVEQAAWRSVLTVPLDALGRHRGALHVCYERGDRPDDAHQAFLRAIADQTAAAIENARLLEAATGTAALEERQRLARDLHDSVSQALYGIALGARTARTLVDEGDPSRLVEPLDYVLGLAEAGLAEMRSLIFELRPEALATEGLVAALDRQLRALRARHGIEVDSSLGHEPELALPVKEALYRVTQEALHNVVKHARAQHVSLTLQVRDRDVSLRIEDDGEGFDPAASRPGHFGLATMRERVEGVGGELEIASEPGHGARLALTIPVG